MQIVALNLFVLKITHGSAFALGTAHPSLYPWHDLHPQVRRGIEQEPFCTAAADCHLTLCAWTGVQLSAEEDNQNGSLLLCSKTSRV